MFTFLFIPSSVLWYLDPTPVSNYKGPNPGPEADRNHLRDDIFLDLSASRSVPCLIFLFFVLVTVAFLSHRPIAPKRSWHTHSPCRWPNESPFPFRFDVDFSLRRIPICSQLSPLRQRHCIHQIPTDLHSYTQNTLAHE